MILTLTKTSYQPLPFLAGLLLILTLSIPRTHAQQQDVDFPFDLSKLIRQMQDDDVPNNATGAYQTILNSRKSLNDKQETTIINRLKQVIRTGDRQQAIFAAGILRRWEKKKSLRKITQHLIPKIIRTLISGVGKTLRYECHNLINEFRSGPWTWKRNEDIQFSTEQVNDILDRKTWKGTRSVRTKSALAIASLLMSDITSNKLTRWLMNNLEADKTRTNAVSARFYLKQMKWKQVIPFLKNGLGSKDRQTRQFSAMIWLNKKNARSRPRFIKILVGGLHDDHIDHNAHRFIHVLQKIGSPALPYLEKALRSDDRQQSQLAAWVLHQSDAYDPTEQYIDELVSGLRDDSLSGKGAFSNRQWTYEALMKIGQRAHPFLLEGIQSDDRQQRVYSARVLIKTGHRASLSKTIPILMEQLKHDDVRGNGKHTEWFLDSLKGQSGYSTAKRHLLKLLRNGTPQQCAASITILDDNALPDSPPESTIQKIRTYISRNDLQMDWLKHAVLYCGEPVFQTVNDKFRGIVEEVFHELHIEDDIPHEALEKLMHLYETIGKPYHYAVLMKFIKRNDKLVETNIFNFQEKYKQALSRQSIKNVKTARKRLNGSVHDVSKQVERTVRKKVEQLKDVSYSKRKKATTYLKQSDPAIVSILFEYYPSEHPEQDKRLKRILKYLLMDRYNQELKNILRDVIGG